jgi:NAD(P)-dependent dehydrogenase (short-subunit alcohol dehydrogenase family)
VTEEAETRPVAIVTGGGTGIGAATARLLAAGGWDVALVGRRQDLLEGVAADVRAAGGSALVIAADLADAAVPALIVAAVTDTFGRLDALVNNAAVIRVMPLADWQVADLDQHLMVNIRAPFLLVQAALPLLRASDRAAVVNISSSSGSMVRAGQSVYGMTKAALEYLTKAFAAELAPDRIRVNSIAPGPVDTPIHETWAEDLDEAYRWLAGQVPLGRIATAEELAGWIVWLIGPGSSWVTGATIPVDGGQVLDRE